MSFTDIKPEPLYKMLEKFYPNCGENIVVCKH